jgi:hypothetical protein
LSFTLMQGSAMMYGIRDLPYIVSVFRRFASGRTTVL